jgi:hypothetical protein
LRGDDLLWPILDDLPAVVRYEFLIHDPSREIVWREIPWPSGKL